MGFPTDRFEGNVESAYLCGICTKVLQAPKFVNIPECEHLFCEDCLQIAFATSEEEGVFVCPLDQTNIVPSNVLEPIRFFQNLYAKLNIRCSFFDECSTVISVSEIAKHEVECEHNPANLIFCQGLCGIRLKTKDVQNHNCGDHFRDLIKKLNDRLTKLEVSVSDIKKQRSVPAKATSHTNGYTAKKVSETTNKPPLRLHASSSAENGQRLLNILSNMIQNYKQFIWDPSDGGNPNKTLFVLLESLSITPRIRVTVRSSGIEKVVDQEMIQSLRTRKINKANMLLLSSLAAMEFLETELTSEKTVALVASDHYTLSPMFASLVNNTVRLASHYICSARIGKKYKILLKPDLVLKMIPFTHKDMFQNLNRAHLNDIIIIFETLTDDQLIEFQSLLKPKGYMLILDPASSFKLITANNSGNLSLSECTQILVENPPRIEQN